MMTAGFVVGCNEEDPPDEEIATVDVAYNGQDITVDLADLEAVTLDDGEEYTRLSDVVEAADLGVALESLEFDFEGSDEFRASSSSNCVDIIPVAGALLAQGYVHRVTRDMAWDESLELPGCTRVDDMARLLASDAGDAPPEVEVVYGETTVTVDLTTLATVEREGEDHVRLTDVVEAASLGVVIADLGFDFEASDGFRPSNSGNCADATPLAGDQIEHGFISVSGRNLSWADDAGLPGCMNLDNVVLIEATDL